MSNESKKYNGWANYETWCVHLWQTSDEATYRYWKEETEREHREARTCTQVRNGIWTVEQAKRIRLAEQLKAAFETFHPFRGEFLAKPNEPDVYCDLLDAALSEVDWHEIAEAFVEEFEPDDEPDPSESDDEDDQADEDDEEAYAVE